MSPGNLSVISYPASPLQPAFIEFKKDGSFTASATKDYASYQSITMFDRFEITDKGKIKFYSSNSTESREAYFSLEDGLLLYFACREFCGDYFIRKN